MVAEIEAKDIKAKELLGVIGNTGTTAGFAAVGIEETKTANLLRWLTIGLFGLGLTAIGASYIRFECSPPTTVAIVPMLLHFLSVLAVAPIAWYTGRESARHRSNAERARKSALELTSINPFIAPLSEEKRQKVLEEMVPKYFGTAMSEPESVEPLAIKAITEMASTIIKAAKP